MEEKLLGIDELERCIDNFLEPFGLTSKLDTDFAYYYEKDLVTFSIFHITANDEFMLDALSRFPQNEGVPSFIWCLCHEIGHHETWEDLTDKQLEDSKQIKAAIDLENDPDSRMLYYTAPDEYEATKWAGNFISDNRTEVENLWYDVLVALGKFYRMNNIVK